MQSVKPCFTCTLTWTPAECSLAGRTDGAKLKPWECHDAHLRSCQSAHTKLLLLLKIQSLPALLHQCLTCT